MAEYSQVPPRSSTATPADASLNPPNLPEGQRAQAIGGDVPLSPMPPSTPQPLADEPLMPPAGGFLSQDFNRDSIASGAPSSFNRLSSGFNSRTSLQEQRGLLPAALGATPVAAGTGASTPDSKNESDTAAAPAGETVESKRRKRPLWIILALIAAVVLVAAAIALGVYFGVVKNKKTTSSSDGGSSDPTPGTNDGSNGNSTETPPPPSVILTGTDGSEVEMEDGTKFIYNNSFAGFWYYDKENPLSGPAGQANSWTSPVNESWRWGIDQQRGVNLGGWLVLEPFISPAVFEKYWPDAVDEFTLTTLMAADTAGGGLTQLEDHYKTFITEQDFANIAAAGLNWIRLPVPFWAISKLPNEPFLEHTAWTYFVKAIVWARKYGLRINLDLHTLPGSQNGWNHSGRLSGDSFNWMRGVMGVANGQRALDVIRVYAEFISKPEVAPIVPMFGIANEPRGTITGETALKTFYLEAYRIIRTVSGIGQGPAVSFHTGFLDGSWDRWVNADRVMLDRHPYLVFAGAQTQDGPMERAQTVCNSFGNFVNSTNGNFGMNSAGEWSASVNDCGLYLNNLGVPADYDTQYGDGACDTWNRWEDWTDDRKADMIHYVSAQMDMLHDYFFWTWRIGASTRNGNRILTSQWSYELGWRNGWIPTDPRTADGECSRLGYGVQVPWDGEFQPYQTTGAGGVIDVTGSGGEPWPPTSLINVGDASQLPVYAPTGPLPTLIAEGAPAALATFTPTMGGQGMMAPIPGCDYPDQYDANDVAIPTGCTLT